MPNDVTPSYNTPRGEEQYSSLFLFQPPDGPITEYYEDNFALHNHRLRQAWGDFLYPVAFSLNAPHPSIVKNAFMQLIHEITERKIDTLIVLEGKWRFFGPIIRTIARINHLTLNILYIDIGEKIKSYEPLSDLIYEALQNDPYIQKKLEKIPSSGTIGIFDECVNTGEQTEVLKSLLAQKRKTEIPSFCLYSWLSNEEQRNNYPCIELLKKDPCEQWFTRMSYPDGCRPWAIKPVAYKNIQRNLIAKILES